MPSLSMDAHSLFQKPTKAWYAMKSTTYATSMSFAGATKVNGLQCTFIWNSQEKWSDLIHLRLPPTKQMDHLPTLPNVKHSWVIEMLWRVYLLYCSWSQHGVLDNPSWQTYAMPVHDHLTLGKVLLPPSSNGTSLFIGHIPRENVRTIHWHDLHHCLSRWHTCTYLQFFWWSPMTTLECFQMAPLQQPSSQCQKIKLLCIWDWILRFHTYQRRATTKGQCDPSSHTALQH
jgi:hypothetical protein